MYLYPNIKVRETYHTKVAAIGISLNGFFRLSKV